MFEELIHTAKVHLLQSVVSRLLVELVFETYFVGLSEEQEQQFAQMESLLSSFGMSPLSRMPLTRTYLHLAYAVLI
jgi:activating signal cointegrator complex subunit 1